MSGNLHRDMGICKVHTRVDDCVLIRVYQESAHLSNGHHLMIQFGNPLLLLLLLLYFLGLPEYFLKLL